MSKKKQKQWASVVYDLKDVDEILELGFRIVTTCSIPNANSIIVIYER